MSDLEKINFFHDHIGKIFEAKSNLLIGFLKEVKDSGLLAEAFENWPDSIKLDIVNRYLDNQGKEFVDFH